MMHRGNLYNYLHERNAKLTLLERENVRDSNLELEANSAFIELLIKVKQSNSDEEAKEFWESRLLNMEKLIDGLRLAKLEIDRLETEYARLYRRSEEILEFNLEMQEKINNLEP